MDLDTRDGLESPGGRSGEVSLLGGGGAGHPKASALCQREVPRQMVNPRMSVIKNHCSCSYHLFHALIV